MTRRSLAAGLVLAVLLGVSAPAQAVRADYVTTGQLLGAPDKWHGRPVVVSGTVTRLEPRTSQQGVAYFTFALVDAGGTVTVFSYGTPDVRDGQRVQVEGRFHKVKRVGKHTFHNQVDARVIGAR